MARRAAGSPVSMSRLVWVSGARVAAVVEAVEAVVAVEVVAVVVVAVVAVCICLGREGRVRTIRWMVGFNGDPV